MPTSAAVFHSLDTIVNVLAQDEFKGEKTEKILKTYENAVKNGLVSKDQKRYPLIVFEGLDGSGKTTLSKKLAEKHNAALFCTPPSSISDIRDVFENDKVLRTAYYSLGNYLAQIEILGKLKEKPVVLDRFWHSTTAYSLAQSVHNGQIKCLPPKGDKIYNWPSDLIQPDMVVFLDVSEEERQRRHEIRNTTNTNQEQLLKSQKEFRNNIIQAYKYMENPAVNFINVDGPIEKCVDDIYNITKYLFDNKI
ncbi:UMP-CMP kinase 2, mitochondrial-like isoform X2 [Onthophagus taurus]|nr:UMP-CMP kinase 2, mitochondrial-like [Onthophagus taurus]